MRQTIHTILVLGISGKRSHILVITQLLFSPKQTNSSLILYFSRGDDNQQLPSLGSYIYIPTVDHLSVYDMTYWTLGNPHPGNAIV